MSLTTTQLHDVREAIGVAISTGSLKSATVAKLKVINQQIIDGTYPSLRGDADAQAAITELHEAVSDVSLYADAVEQFSKEIMGSAPASSTPAPKPGTTPQATDNSIELNAAELKIVLDQNFNVREVTGPGSLYDRLYNLNMAIEANAWRTFTDPDVGYLVSLIAAVKGSDYPPNRAAIEKFAAALGVKIRAVTIPSSSSTATPAPSAEPAPVPQVPGGVDVQKVLDAFAAIGIKIGATVHAPLILESKNGVGIYLRSDTDNNTGQRDPGTTYPQWFGVAISGDAGGGLFQNIIYPEDGSPAYIPDPTRIGITWRLDRMGAMSVDVMTAGREFAPGRYEVISNLGQCFVFGAMPNGDMILRMPQENTALYVEQGFGGNPTHLDANGNQQGHRETKFRRRVMLEGGWD